ncbi:hypothetical protein AGMMS49975_05060 [Clostridia bacterium]|nr:hypothetical protein AGMMS49975_05060 [Clostridia bacterium]GHU74627.1 hypothetical protein FACS1894188_03450 [Clostridia bacterium]
MLALTRKKGESIMVGDDVEIVVLDWRGEQIKLGIIAPKSIPIHRKEIYEQIHAENKKAMISGDISDLKNIALTPKKSQPE